jgi:hypothetical protein
MVFLISNSTNRVAEGCIDGTLVQVARLRASSSGSSSLILHYQQYGAEQKFEQEAIGMQARKCLDVCKMDGWVLHKKLDSLGSSRPLPAPSALLQNHRCCSSRGSSLIAQMIF